MVHTVLYMGGAPQAHRDVTLSVEPAGFDNVQGILTAAYVMDPTDPTWKDHEDMKAFTAWMAKYHPTAHIADLGNVSGYTVSFLMAETLRRCGDLLTRENVMRQAANLKDLKFGLLFDGITVNTSPTNYFPITQMQLLRFKGEMWEMYGPVLEGKITD